MKPIDDGKPNRKSALFGCGCLMSPFLLLLGLFVFWFALMPLYDDFRLSRFERDFSAISHPAQTKFVARTKEVGTFGNGHHTDFLVAEVRSFAGSKNAVRNFYKSTRVAVPNSDDDDYSDVKNGTQPVDVEFLRSPLPQKYIWKFASHDEINLASAAGRKNLYVVLICNSG